MNGKARRLLAFIDESQSNRRLDPETYILAAGVCDPVIADAVRTAVSALRLKGQRKLHWRDESLKRRLVIAEAIARLPLEHLIVVRDGTEGERVERRRRLCLERLLYELDQLHVACATFESRGAADDRRDRSMLDALRARRTVSASLRIVHEKGPLEALLWIPDAVCGAVAGHRTGDTIYLDLIRETAQLRLIDVTT